MNFFNIEQEMFGMLLEALPNIAGQQNIAKVCELDEEEMAKKPIGHRKPTNKGERHKTEVRKRFNKACKANKHRGARVDAHERAIVYTDRTKGVEVMLKGRELAVSAHDTANYYDPTSLLRKMAADGAKLHDAFDGMVGEYIPSFQNNEFWEEDYWSAYERLKRAEKTLKEVEKRLDDIQAKMTSEVTMTLEEAYEAYSDLVEERAIVRGDYYVAIDKRDSALQHYQFVYDKYI